MRCSFENNLTLRKAVVLATMLLVTSTGSACCCENCEPRLSRERDDAELTVRKLPLKKDIFMSRGWGAGGGTPFAARRNSDLYKKNRVVADLINDDYKAYEQLLEPRVEFLRSPNPSNPIAERGRLPTYVPQLFISSGWGPLGK